MRTFILVTLCILGAGALINLKEFCCQQFPHTQIIKAGPKVIGAVIQLAIVAWAAYLLWG